MTDEQICAVMALADAYALTGYSAVSLTLAKAMPQRAALESALRAMPAEFASERADTDRLNWIAHQFLEDLTMHLVVDAQHDGQYCVCGDSNKPGYGPTLRAAIDAAMAGNGAKGQL